MAKRKLNFFDTCVTILDNPQSPVEDATQLQQLVDDSRVISKEQFKVLVEIAPEHEGIIDQSDTICQATEGGEMAWFYCGEDDIHYFYY